MLENPRKDISCFLGLDQRRSGTELTENSQDQLSFPAMQVTSSHVSIWFHLPASYDEYTALVKFGNVASEHVK